MPWRPIRTMSKIPLRVLGKTGLEVSALGLGCASLWARRGFSEARAATVFEQALALGVNFFDTGPAYAGGHAEWRLGRLLKAVGGEADKLLVASKFGTRADSRSEERRVGKECRSRWWGGREEKGYQTKW